MNTYKVLYQGAPLNSAKKALILLHGRGGSAEDILPLADYFCDETFLIAALEARDNEWYPHSFMEPKSFNEPKLSDSIDNVGKLIEEIGKSISLSQIYLMGFSQGACLALEFSARYAQKYGGIVAFSGGLIGETIDEKTYHGHFDGTKVFLGVSDQDPHIPLSRVKGTKNFFEKKGADVTLNVYRGISHTINDDEIAWVKKNIF